MNVSVSLCSRLFVLISLHAFLLSASSEFPVQKIKDAVVRTWDEVPVWGKVLAGGAATVGVFGAMYMLSHRQEESQISISDRVFSSDLLGDITPHDVRMVLSHGDGSSHILFERFSTDMERVNVLKAVFKQIISERYTHVEKEIVRNLLEYKSLFKAEDWFELWQYACNKEASENEAVIRNWLGTYLVTHLFIHSNDLKAVGYAVESGVNMNVPVFFTDGAGDDQAFSSSSVETSICLSELYIRFLSHRSVESA